jgi:hypothetical protein
LLWPPEAVQGRRSPTQRPHQSLVKPIPTQYASASTPISTAC